MSKTHHKLRVRKFDDGQCVIETLSGSHVTDFVSPEWAESLVREHNAHEALFDCCVEAATELREFIEDCIEDPNDFDFRVVKSLEAAIALASASPTAEGAKQP